MCSYENFYKLLCFKVLICFFMFENDCLSLQQLVWVYLTNMLFCMIQVQLNFLACVLVVVVLCGIVVAEVIAVVLAVVVAVVSAVVSHY